MKFPVARFAGSGVRSGSVQYHKLDHQRAPSLEVRCHKGEVRR